jgi:hypothetical protein
MSEYQFYDFAAVDTPLTPKQQEELRARSTRATITATSFTNEYHWGDLKGDPLDWMKRYFDAHVYSANWGSCILMLRLPRSAIDKATLDEFAETSRGRLRSVHGLGVTTTPDYWILQWSCDDDSGDHERFWSEADGPGWMSRLLPLREELLRGDPRPLYLGWLARVFNGELPDEAIEPPLPAGLQTLTPAQTALAEFLLIDIDWLAAASEASAPLASEKDDDSAIGTWLDLQTLADMRAVLHLVLGGRGAEAERSFRRRFIAWQSARQVPQGASADRRTVAQLRARSEVAEAIRIERERKAEAAQAARQRAAREKQLAQLAMRADQAWADIDKSLRRGTGAGNTEALHAVTELSEALALSDRKAEFQRGLLRLMSTHGKRPAWVKRLTKAGFL